VLILRLPYCRWSLSLVGEEEDDERDGGALGASLCVASALDAEQERIK
jgi:hypothetical protein